MLALAAVVVLRPLVAESYDSAQTTLTAALGQVSDPSPVRTLVFDLVILAGACGWLLARAVGPAAPFRRTGLEWGTVIIAMAAALSCAVAGNKRVAIGASLDWICLPVLAIVLVQLMERPWQRRLFVAGVLASAAVQAVHCFDQFYVSFDDTWAQYQSDKAAFWAKQGVELDSSAVELFERRALAREASGFLAHSNVTGSYLVLCGLTALGPALAGWTRAGGAASALAALILTFIAAVILGAVPLTNSTGAMVSAAAAAALWSVLRFSGGWIERHRTAATKLGWGAAAFGLSAFVAHGAYFGHVDIGSLPFRWQESLVFRWQYWATSCELIADHPVTGVGRENFGAHYVAYKDIGSPEEIANPHNLFVQAAADWGLPGLLGMVVLVIGAVRTATGSRLSERGALDVSDEQPGLGRTATWAACLGAVVTIGRLPLLESDDPNFRYAATVTTGLIWVPVFLAFLWAAPVIGERAARGRGVRELATKGTMFGLCAFLLHDLLNFAMFVPGSAVTAFALVGVCISEKAGPKGPAPTSTRANRWIAFGAATGLVTCIAMAIGPPVVCANRCLAEARRAEPHERETSGADAMGLYAQAAACDPLDPTAYTEHVTYLLRRVAREPRMAQQCLEVAERSLEQALARDRCNVKLRRMKTKLYRVGAEIGGEESHFEQAVDAAKSALELYPQDPVGIAVLGECQLAAGAALGRRRLIQDAIESYERALRLDDARPEWERIRGFRRWEKDALNAQLRTARDMLANAP